MGWLRVETEDLVIRTDVGREKAVRLAASYQRLRTAIAENELPCAFERSNVPMEFVLLKDPRDIEDLAGRHTAGFSARPPSSHLDAKLQLVMDSRQAAIDSQLFVHELTHGAVAICFPGGRPWLHEGMASFYEAARIDGGELILGMPAYGFVPMTNVEPMFDIYPVRANGAEVWMLPSRLLPDFDALRRMDANEFYFLGKRRSVSDLRQRTAHYAGSWLAVHPMSQVDAALLRSRLYAWAQTLRVSAQTAFQLAALGEYFVRVAGDPSSGFESLQKSLTLDATSWRTYALMGEALAELGEPEKAKQAYYTAIALTGHGSRQLRDALKQRIHELDRPENP